ncbi:MAG TPA: SEC-C metal-binding domain-containing protein [Thermoguttaceae bacterium]|nr:SEC-C metal-binding domain-containing protein [Thermoguttaceae bacterium]
MDATLLSARGETLAKYQRFREISRGLNRQLVESLDGETIHEAGRRLGILRRNVLVFDSEETMSVLMDYAIHHVRRDGLNAVERRLAASPPPPESEEMKLLRAIRDVRYGLFQVKQVFRGLGLKLRDVLRDETGLLTDVGFSQSAGRGFIFASHVYSPENFWVTTGTALPVLRDFAEQLFRQIERRFGDTPDDFRRISREQQTELATLVIRTCLEEGVMQRVAYGEPRVDTAHCLGPMTAPPPKPASEPVRVGRNDPCPCGSGRKYKNCCRRKG